MGDQKDGIGEAPRSTEVPQNFASVEASVLDEIVREKKNAHKEDGSTPEDRIIAVFNKIHEVTVDGQRSRCMKSHGVSRKADKRIVGACGRELQSHRLVVGRLCGEVQRRSYGC
ncbi:uncharacterized protein DS421_9g270330 [Arachis hypogaea]|nr:uncharacterized protein DS421_9g270330 [Arachis hypogaea]